MERGLEGSGKVPRIVQVMYFKGLPRQVSQQSDMGLPQQWEAQWQEFLKTLQPTHMGWGNPQLMDPVPWDDARGFLAAFEQVAEACRWPREEWVGRLLPALRGGVEQYFCRLDARERGDYLKVKAAILRADAIRAESKRQHFRQCCYQEIEGPRRIYSTLQELCRQWLKPEKHTKEQILELIIQEQLLAMLPPEVQSWVQECGPEDCIEMVALAEDFLMRGRRRHVAKSWDWQVPTVSSLEAEGPQRQHCIGVNWNGDREINLMANEMTPIRNSGLPLPPEGQEVAGVGINEEPVDVKDVLNLNQTPLHWEVMRENGGGGSALEGLLIPTPETISQPDQQEAIFAQRPEHGETIPDNFLSGRVLSEIKIETPQQADSETEDTFEALPSEFPGGAGGPSEINNNSLQLQRESPAIASLSPENSESSSVSRLRPRKPQGLGVPGIKTLRVVLTNLASSRKGGHHICPECGFSSEWLSEVVRHMRIHTRERPYTCPECGKTYRWSSNLYQHRKRNACSHKGHFPNASLVEPQVEHEVEEEPQTLNNSLQEKIKLEDVCGTLPEASLHAVSLSREACENRPASRGRQGKGQEGSHPYRRAAAKRSTKDQKKKKHACSECGYRAARLSDVVNHARIHTGEKPFECPDCGKTFRWLSNIAKHQQIHASHQQAPVPETSAVPNTSVAECDVTLSDEEELINILAKNPQQGGTKLEDRLGMSPGESPAATSLSPEASEIRATSKPHPGEGEGKGRSARLKRNAVVVVKKNRYTQLERKHECPDCGHRTYYLSDLVRHQRIHTGERPYKCRDCGKTFAQKSSLTSHQKTHVSNSGLSSGKRPIKRKGNSQGERKHTCSKCGHKTYKLSTLLVHMKIHAGEKPYKCLECGQTFSWSSNLSRHKRLHQRSGGSNNRKVSLSKHQAKRKGNKKLSKTTEVNPRLKRTGDISLATTNGDTSTLAAMRERWRYNKQQEKKATEGSDGSAEGHNGSVAEAKDNSGGKEAAVRARLEKFAYSKGGVVDDCQSALSTDQTAQAREKLPYECSHCGKYFKVKQHLTDHLHSHTGEKPYTCSECGKCFSWKNKLLRHQIIHTGVKQFHCSDCGKDFFRKDSLMTHLKTHDFQPVYECSECGQSFDQKDQLVRHQRSHAEQCP